MNGTDDDKTPQSTPIPIDRVLDVLKRGTVETEHGLMRWSSNYTFLVSVTHDDDKLLAVYKPRSGERPLWDFPEGTLCQREVATFLTSHELGWQLVPPTTLRDGPRGVGSVQFFIDHDPECNYFSFDETVLPQLMRMVAFDCIVNNADRKGGHCLLDEQGHLWGIDHGITFHSAHKLRTVIWDFAGQSIPESYLDDLDRICGAVSNTDSVFHQSLNDLLSPVEIDSFHGRIRRLLKTRRYPQPGPGPNYPWPPV